MTAGRGSTAKVTGAMGRKAGYALRHPRYAMKRIAREALRSDERDVANVIGISHAEVIEATREAAADPVLTDRLSEVNRTFGNSPAWADVFGKSNRLIYALTRLTTPDSVVETGVANGISSLYILAALKRNGKGTLHSIDRGEDFLTNQSTGWVVPDDLSSSWRIRVGDASQLLPKVLEDLGEIDMFLHDSDHSYEHMTFEFGTALPRLRSGGLLLSDDADFNSSFTDFTTAHRLPSCIVVGLGVSRKTA